MAWRDPPLVPAPWARTAAATDDEIIGYPEAPSLSSLLNDVSAVYLRSLLAAWKHLEVKQRIHCIYCS